MAKPIRAVSFWDKAIRKWQKQLRRDSPDRYYHSFEARMETVDINTGRMGLPYVTHESLTGENYRFHLEENWGLIAESLNGRLVERYGNQITIVDWYTFLIYEALEPVYGEVTHPEYGDTYTDVVGYSRPTFGTRDFYRGDASSKVRGDYGDPLESWSLEQMQDSIARGGKDAWGPLTYGVRDGGAPEWYVVDAPQRRRPRRKR